MENQDTEYNSARLGAMDEPLIKNTDSHKDDRKWYQKLWAFVKPAPCPWTLSGYLRLFFVVLIIALLILAIIFHRVSVWCVFRPFITSKCQPLGQFLGKSGPLRKFIQSFNPVVASILYASIYAAATVLMIPGSVLTITAGYIFESLWVGFATISAGSTVGATLAFILGRSVLRNWVVGKVAAFPVFKAIDLAIHGKKGFLMVFLLRLSPVLPFNLLNYALALTAVPLPFYVIASWIGMMPGTLLYVEIGWVAANLATNSAATSRNNLVKNILIYGVGSVATITAVVLITIFAKRELNKAMKQVQAQEKDDSNEEEGNSPIQ